MVDHSLRAFSEEEIGFHPTGNTKEGYAMSGSKPCLQSMPALSFVTAHRTLRAAEGSPPPLKVTKVS